MRIVRERPAARRRADLAEPVRAIVEEVRTGGDAAVLRLTERFDRAELRPEQLRVPPAEIEAAVAFLEPAVLEGLRTAIRNVRTVVDAQLREPVSVELSGGTAGRGGGGAGGTRGRVRAGRPRAVPVHADHVRGDRRGGRGGGGGRVRATRPARARPTR